MLCALRNIMHASRSGMAGRLGARPRRWIWDEQARLVRNNLLSGIPQSTFGT